MHIAIPLESASAEVRVAAVPETVKKFIGLGASVTVQKGAGAGSNIPDSAYSNAGAKIAASFKETVAKSDIVLKIRHPKLTEISALKKGASLFCLMSPHSEPEIMAACAKQGVQAFAMELMPRISRAQSMDVLSSQANLSGYRAVIEGAWHYGRSMPMMMTAAGTVPPARLFVMGVGVAGLQAIATARRLGAVVSATDVRPATEEQVASLGADFVAVKDDEFLQAQTEGGYAKEMSAAYKAKQAKLIAEHIGKQNIVITTALIPGRPAPRLLSAAMVKSMQPGSVIVDLATAQGGNVEGAKPDELVTTREGVTIVGYTNMACRIAAESSALFARNLFNFISPMIGKNGAFNIDWDDELVVGTCLTRAGKIIHGQFAKQDAKASSKSGSKTVAKASSRSGPKGSAKARSQVGSKTSSRTSSRAKTSKSKGGRQGGKESKK